MATPAQVVEQGISNGFERAQARRQELEDEQRKATLKTLQEDAETPQDKVAAIQAVYHRDPSVLKQHVENLTRRLTGKQAQPVVSPQDAQQARIAPLAARGKTPEQQDTERYQQQTDYANKGRIDTAKQEEQQKQQQTLDLIDKYVTDPEQNKAAKEDYARKQAGIQANFKNLPGAAGQPYKTPNGMWVRPIQNADGSISEQPMPAGYAGPQAKPTKPLYKVIRNHAVLLDPNTGAVLIDLGLATEAKTTVRETPITDSNGNVHIEKLTSVAIPGGGSVDVDVAPGEDGSTPSKGPAPKKEPTHPSSSATAKPSEGRTLPFSKATPQSNAAKKQVDASEKSYLDVQKAGANGSLDPVGSQGVVLSWLRGRVNRVTATEIASVRNLGGIFDKFDGNVSSLEKGTMSPQQYQWFLRSAKQNYENDKQVASKYDAPAPKADGKHKVGESKAFPNGKTGVWDGQGWVAQ
jgi:hypothetical protein